MATRIDTDLQAVYIHEPLGHEVPALNTPWLVAGKFRLEADVNLNTLIVALYGTTAAANWVGLYMNADGITCQLEGYNGGSPTVSSSYTLEVGREYHLAIDYNGAGTVRMLLDGAVVLSMAFTPNAGTPGERSLQWGGYGEISGYTDCTIASWRMWTALLTEAELRREFRSTVPVRTRNLIHDWPMVAGSGRFNDTLAGEPDLEDNPAVPCGDGTAFVLRPSVIGTPQFFDLGETATPGARTINVPEWAEFVVVQTYESDDAGTPDSTLTSLTSDFAGTFAIDPATATNVAMATAVATATVLNWGTGRSFTPVFAAANTVAGAGCWVTFLQDVGGTFPTDTDKAQASGTGGTAGTASATGVADGLALAVDTRLDPAAGNYPVNQTDWTSLNTGQTTGAITYWASSRIRQKAITAGGTETATTQNTNGSCVSIATVAARALATVAPTVALPVPGDVTPSGSNTASGSWPVAFPDAALGDLLTVNLAWDDSTTVTAVTPPAGPNGETATAIVSAVASNGTEVRAQAWRYIATGTWAAGTRNFTPNASESWQAHVLRVRAGEFDATTPIGAATTRASAGTAETSMLSPAFSAGATDGGGRLVMYGTADDDPVIANATGWSTLATADLGAVTGTLAVRNLETTDSESLAEATWRIASDSWATLAYVVRKPSTGSNVTLGATGAAQAAATAALSLVKAMAAAAAGQAAGSAAMAVLKPLGATGAAAADADADLQVVAPPVDLAATGAAASSASASLLKGVTLSAAGLAVVSASASTSHSVPLQATGVAVAVSGALMALAVTLSASGLSVAAASAGASLVKALGATGAAQASGSANLATSSSTDLLASGAAVASSTAVLSLLVTLSGAAVAQAQAAAAVSVAKPLGAASTAQAGGTATLATSSSADLEAHGSAQASSGASLWLDVPVTAAALSQALAGGSLTLSVPLRATAVSQASGAASLAGAIALNAGGSAASDGTASLQVMGPVFEFARGMVAKNERRDWTARNERRSWRATA